MGWGDLIGAYGAAQSAYAEARTRLRSALALFDTLIACGMSQDGARRAADLDRLLDEAVTSREELRLALRSIQDNSELVGALSMVAAAEGLAPQRRWRDEPAND